MRLERRLQPTYLAPWQIALIVVGALIALALIYAFYTIFRLRTSKQTDQYPLGLKIFSFSSPRRTGARDTNASRRRVDGRSKRRRGSAHLSSADDGVVGKNVGREDEDDKEMDSPVKLSRLLNKPVQPVHRSPVGVSPSTISMMHYHNYNDGEEEELSPPPPPTGSTLRPSTGFTSTSSITRSSFPSPYNKESASLHDVASTKEYASTTSEHAHTVVGSPISSPIHPSNGDPLSTSFKSTGGFSLGNTLGAALDKHRHRRGSKSSTATAPTPSSPPNNSNFHSGLPSPPPRPGSGSAISSRPRSHTQSDTQTKSPRSRGHTSRSQTRTLDDGQGTTTSAGGGASSPLSPSSLGASLGLFTRHNNPSTHQQSKSNHAVAQHPTKSTTSHHLSKEDGWRDQTYERDPEREHFDDGDSVAHTIRASMEEDNYYQTYGEQDREMDEQVSTSFTTQSGMTGSGSGTSNAHGDITPRGGASVHSTPRIASPRIGTSTGRLGSSHSTSSHAPHTFTPPTTAMSRTTFAENGVAVPFSGIGLAFGRAGRDTPVDTPRDLKRAEKDKDKENSRRRGRERNEEYG